MVSRGKVWQARSGGFCSGVDGLGMLGHDMAGEARLGMLRTGTVRRGEDRHGKAWFGRQGNIFTRSNYGL